MKTHTRFGLTLVLATICCAGTGASRMFDPASAPQVLDRILKERGLAAETLTPDAGIAAMFDFYRSARAHQCPLDEDGDMLLFQWGTYDSGAGEFFELDITRQFVPEEYSGDGEGILQLHMTFRFPPSEELRGFESGNRWCGHPSELPEFERFVLTSAAFRAVAARRDAAVEILYGDVG